MRDAGVTAIYLIHGTFVGADGFGFLRELARVWPTASDVLRKIQKQAIDRVAGELGNFTPLYARQLQDSLQGEHPTPIPVRLFHWSSENHHIGRADGAVRLLDELSSQLQSEEDSGPGPRPAGGRILLVGHSHGGNLLALVTNLLANDRSTNERFFRATRPYYCWPGTERIDIARWQRTADMLADPDHPLRANRLDVVTMGTPIRYGWDTAGCATLLHVVHHRRDPELPDFVARLPVSADDVLQASGGDVVQQLGIAGTNFAPPLWAWRAAMADRALGRLVQPGLRRRDLLSRLRLGCRVHADGTTLLVDYGASDPELAQQLAGHAIYTHPQWLPFHLDQIARHCYGWSEERS